MGWTEQYNSVCTDLLALAGDTAFTGADSIKNYIMETHVTLCQCLLTILEEYGARFALYVTGLYDYDNNKYANINEDALTAVTEELGKAA